MKLGRFLSSRSWGLTHFAGFKYFPHPLLHGLHLVITKETKGNEGIKDKRKEENQDGEMQKNKERKRKK